MAELAALRQRPFLTLSFAKKLHQKTPYAAPAHPHPGWIEDGEHLNIGHWINMRGMQAPD